MNLIKEFLINCGYEESLVESLDVKFESPQLLDLIKKWRDEPFIKQFVAFAARNYLIPYSGDRECLLFSLKKNGTTVKNTVIGGFDCTKKAFNLTGDRFDPRKLTSDLATEVSWKENLVNLGRKAEQLGISFDTTETGLPKYFRISLNQPNPAPIISAFINEWLNNVNKVSNESIVQYFSDIFAANGGDDGEWIKSYRLSSDAIKSRQDLDDDFIQLLWTKATDSVASIKNGIMSGIDYQQSKSELISFTRRIWLELSPELYQESDLLLNNLRAQNLISRRYWATKNRVFSSLHPTSFSTTVDENALRKVYVYLNNKFSLNLPTNRELNWYELNRNLLDKIQPLLKDVMDVYAINVTIWFIYEVIMKAEEGAKKSAKKDNLVIHRSSDMKSPLNQILYGPPGTGKTYHSIEAAVKAAEPSFTFEHRKELKVEYERLVAENRIRFVTFHQSYGYEEFVEGLRASTEGDNISYDVEPGVFKSICAEAKANQVTIRNEGVDGSFTACWAAFIEQFDEDGSRIETKKSFYKLTHFNEKTIYFEKSNGDTTHTLSLNTLKDVFNNERIIKGGLDVYYHPLIKHLRNLAPASKVKENTRKNYVLIIDEINRGNISKIFGELITLIEPSKRFGEDEALELILPHSPGKTFSVPNNLHIIGTMNTADRSLAMMDTALRRRFDFVEMMPNTALFNGINVKGINLQLMLETMNKRIEVLYDREHTLGHAFFMPVKALVDKDDQAAAFKELQSVFKNKIIPLLEEYFFEDWNKIRLVLGDNQKDKSLRFITENKQSYDDIFGSNHGLDSYETESTTYALAAFDGDDSVWSKTQAYIGIYSPSSVNSNNTGNE